MTHSSHPPWRWIIETKICKDAVPSLSQRCSGRHAKTWAKFQWCRKRTSEHGLEFDCSMNFRHECAHSTGGEFRATVSMLRGGPTTDRRNPLCKNRKIVSIVFVFFFILLHSKHFLVMATRPSQTMLVFALTLRCCLKLVVNIVGIGFPHRSCHHASKPFVVWPLVDNYYVESTGCLQCCVCLWLQGRNFFLLTVNCGPSVVKLFRNLSDHVHMTW